MSSYDSAKSGLKDLTRGTAEFTAAVVAANDEALKLISNYSDLITAEDYYVNSDGVLEISEDAMERVKQKEAEEMMAAQSAAIIGKQ